MEAKLEKGDIAHIDYDLWIVGPGDATTLHETTHADVAKAADTYEEKRAYAAIPVVVGHGRIPKGLDEALLGTSVGETKEFVIPPDKGAGERDPKLVKLYPIREFYKKDIEPTQGLEVHMDGRHGVIMAVTAGRVRVDFNNPLAGRTLRYKVTVTKRAESAEEKARGILDLDYGLGDQFKVFVKEGGAEADVFLPDVCKTDERWFASKFRVVADLREFAAIPKVRFVEEYEKKEEKKAEETPAEAAVKPEAAKAEPPKPKKGRARRPPPKKAERAEEELPPPEDESPAEKSPEEL